MNNMREIRFRGKVTDGYNGLTGSWVFGHLVVRPINDNGYDKYFICEIGHKFIRCLNKMPCTYEVDPDTVGQYTGLTDKNGKRIFEGDIVFVPRLGKTYEVVFKLGQFCIGINAPLAYERHECEVVGNIHDNPELIAVAEGDAHGLQTRS